MIVHERLRTAGLWALLALCLAGWVLPQASIDFRRARWGEAGALLFLPTGEYLQAASLGYQGVVADALYLWSIQYYGHHRTSEGRRYLWRIYDVITDLDPRYQDAYLTGAMVMAVDMSDPELAIRLLEKGAVNNPQDWIYPLEAGYYAWMDLEEPQRAAEYFDQALALEGVSPVVRRVRAEMENMSGNVEAALGLWIDIFDEAVRDRDQRLEAIAWQHVYDLKVGIDTRALGAALARFRADRGRPPRVLEALATEGYLQSVPRAPDGTAYEYDPVSGGVTDPRDEGSRAGR